MNYNLSVNQFNNNDEKQLHPITGTPLLLFSFQLQGYCKRHKTKIGRIDDDPDPWSC
jgi:hypothetical protein